ncbi:MAG: hypothetical protein ACT4QG_04440 [Sporichthyaceae bacterium]
MTSRAHADWSSRRVERLDRLVAAHRAVGGVGRGRRWLTTELNHALIVRLASEFQGFCRDLHDESIRVLVDVRVANDPALAALLRSALERDRKLDRGNATWGNVVDDFGRFGLSLRDVLAGSHEQYGEWIGVLDRLNQARNALAHDNSVQLARFEQTQRLTLATFRSWR